MTEPSKVIHVRNVGLEISESDLLQLLQPFGAVSKLVMLRAKNQALLQMQDVSAALNAIQYYTNVQPSVKMDIVCIGSLPFTYHMKAEIIKLSRLSQHLDCILMQNGVGGAKSFERNTYRSLEPLIKA